MVADLALGVEREVQLQHVHARLSEEAELTPLRVSLDERADASLVHPARLRDAMDLIGIETLERV